MRRSIGRSVVVLHGVPPQVQARRLPQATLQYSPVRRPGARTHRGLTPLILSAVALVPAVLSLLLVSSGRYLDPFAFILLIPCAAASLLLGITSLVTLVYTARQPRPAWSDLQRPALAVHILFWCIVSLAAVIFASRI